MADYKEMYAILLKDMTKAISILQEAQRKTEEIYMLDEETRIKLLPKNYMETKSVTYQKKKLKKDLIRFD